MHRECLDYAQEVNSGYAHRLEDASFLLDVFPHGLDFLHGAHTT